jgi:Tfp pilus assembly protein PilV
MDGTIRKNPSEAGFTLIETLTAIVILVFGLVAVTNLLIVAGTSNQVANVATATTAAARERLEILKATPFDQLSTGGSLDADVTSFFEAAQSGGPIPGIGTIRTRWSIEVAGGDNQLRFIQVRSESTSPLLRSRSRAQLSTFRACTDQTLGCPEP